MKLIINKLKEEFVDKKKLLNAVIVFAIAIFSTLTNNNYNMNPFIGLTLIYFASCSFLLLSVNVIVILTCAFINSLYYGIEIAIISFFWLALFSLPKFKENKILNCLPIIIFYSVLTPLFLLNNFNQTSIIKSIFSFLFTLSGYYTLINKNQTDEIHQINKYITLSFLPSLFYSYNSLLLPAVIFTFYFALIKTKTIGERLSFLACSFLISYFYLLMPAKTLIMIYPAFFISSLLLNANLSLISYTVIIEALNIVNEPTRFFKSETFYFPLIALTLALLILTPNKITINDKTDDRQLTINNIHEYLNIIMDNSIDPYLDKKSLRENLKIKSCSKCSHQEDCIHLNRFVENLPNKLYKPYKDEALKNCPNGGKLVYRYKVLKEMVAYEQKSQRIKQEQYSALKSIVAPIKSLCYKEEENKVSTETVNNNLKKDIICTIEDEKIKAYEKLSPVELKTTENILNKKLDSYPRFNLLDHTFSYDIKSDFLKNIEIKAYKKDHSQNSGDIINHYKSYNYEELALIDAMGHNASSYKHGKIAERLLTLSRTNDASIEERLEEINTILSYQGGGENFLAIDFLFVNIDEIKLYKFGSPNSFLIKKDNVEEIVNNNPPLGIVSNLEYTPFKLYPNEGDKLLLISDGITIDKYTLEKLNKENDLSIESILKSSIINDDDISILLINFVHNYEKEKQEVI